MPLCTFYMTPLSIKHILLHCPDFNASRKLYEVRSLRDLFSKILPEKILDFFYHMLI